MPWQTRFALTGEEIRKVRPGLYTALPEAAFRGAYDRKAAAYDAVVGRSAYHRVFWGTSPASYTRFAREALHADAAGSFAEVGCGSLLFTASMYADPPARPVLLIDRSMPMLRRGFRRIAPSGIEPPHGIVMLHADAGALPLDSASLTTILSLNLLHVPCDRPSIIGEWARLLVPGEGRLFVSSLVRTKRWSNAWLSVLHRAGELGPAYTRDELCDTVTGDWAVIERVAQDGHMCFVVARHR